MINDIGFIGLGQMGLPMVSSLAQAGFRVVAFDADSARTSNAGSFKGVEIAQSCEQVAARVPVLFTCLPSVEAVQSVYLGQGGVARGARSGLVTCDCSTMTPEVALSLGKELRSQGVHHLEAPIFGTPQQAEDRQIYFAVSGDESHVASLTPFFDAMARGHRYVGGSGAAYAMKLLQNGLGNTYAAIAAEIFALCGRLDVDVERFIEVVKEADALGQSNYFDMYAVAAARNEDSGGGRLYISAKDTALVRDLASKAALVTPILDATAEAFSEAMKAGWADEEFTAVSRVIERRAALTQTKT